MTAPTPPGSELPIPVLPAGPADATDPQLEADPRRGRFRFTESLRRRTARGTLINSGFLISLSGLSLLRNFALAVFLTTQDFGLIGLLAASLATLIFLKQAAIGDKYIQQDEADQEAAFQKAFTLELLATGALIVLLAAAVPMYAWLYGVPELVAPGLVSLAGVAATIFHAPLWIFYRRMEFGRQRLLQAIDPVVGFATAVPLAAAGAGYWAPVAAVVVGPWATAIAAVAWSPIKLRLRFDRATLGRYAGFSWPLFVSGGSTLVIAQAGIVATEASLGLAAAGVITLAATITNVTDRVDQLVTGTLYPAVCAVKDRLALLQESFVKSNRLALMWAVPFGVAITLFCPDLVTFGIGEKWRPAVGVLQVYGLAAAVNHIGFNWTAYLRARGHTRPIAVAAAAAALAFLAVGLPLLFAYGLPGFAVGVAAAALVSLLFRAYYLERLFEGFDYLRHAVRAVVPTLPAAGAVLLGRFVESGERTLGLALGELCLFVAVTVVATWYFESRLLREAFDYLKVGRSAGTASAG